MVPTAHLLAFTITALVLIAVPGPSVLFTVSRAIALGRVAGVATVAGNTVGAFTQVVAVAFGLGPLVERSVALFTVLKLAGACYLVYLGVQAIRHRRSLAEALGAEVERKTAARLVVDWPHRFLAGAEVDARTVICVLTHDPKFDVPVLEVALRTPAGYVG
ncbi:MAG TPA: LysE family transporter, partial [Streptosporangiaceae bacterium]